MTPPQFKTLKDGFLDFVFGKRRTPEEQALAKAALPPRNIRRIYDLMHLLSAASVLIVFLWTFGWLPLGESRLDRGWFWPVFGLNVALRLVWDVITRHYEPLAKARMSEAL